MLFPAAPPVGPQSASAPRAPLGAWQGIGIVLLVDDEDSVRTLGARMLERIGFQVLVASDGQEALELYQVRQGEIVLVLLDLTMPYMDGEETFQQLRRFDPQVRVVMTSGYTETEMALRFTGQPGAGSSRSPIPWRASPSVYGRRWGRAVKRVSEHRGGATANSRAPRC